MGFFLPFFFFFLSSIIYHYVLCLGFMGDVCQIDHLRRRIFFFFFFIPMSFDSTFDGGLFARKWVIVL